MLFPRFFAIKASKSNGVEALLISPSISAASLALIKQPQTGTHHVAGQRIASFGYFSVDEVGEMIAKADRCVLAY